jgi:septum formation protein
VRLLLASRSPRRAELLRQIGVAFEVRVPDIDEMPHDAEAPESYVQRLALEKARAVAADDGCAVLAADTTVICGAAILGKPRNHDEARAMLRQLSGTRHSVCTAVCLRAVGREHQCTVTTEVEFCVLGAAMIDAYIGSGEPWDKAGGYGIQGLAGALVRRIDGSYSNVVGLPLCETRELLEAAGIPTALGRGDAP